MGTSAHAFRDDAPLAGARTSPGVSVVIPVYNSERHVGEAIESILAQTFTDFELILIDDGSTDRSHEVMRSYRDPRIRLVRNDSNLGIPKTRNEGVFLAEGDYLAFLDHDDYAYPRRLEKQVAFLERRPDCAAVGSWAVWVYENGRPSAKVKKRPVSPDDISSLLLFRSGVQNSSSVMRTSVLRDLRYREEDDVIEDHELWVRMAARHRLANLPEILVRHRKHAGQATQREGYGARERQLTIFRMQLEALGLDVTAADLERHFLIPRMGKMGFLPDAAYLAWAEDWLLKLQAANREARRYPEPAFSEMLACMWTHVCWFAARRLGWRAWRRCLASPLRRGSWSGLRKHVLFLGVKGVPASPEARPPTATDLEEQAG